ncbi:MAG: response regulator transcription factor [Chloroflexi bacterium]|nr:response regulator transcription factor [Chloroflexota bacterium]
MTQTILIVSEDKSTQESLLAMLLKEGYGVSSVTDGQSALDTLESEEINVALISLDLPDMSGIKVMRKAGKISPDTKIILLAKGGSMESVIEAIRYNAHDYILKSFDPEEILASVTKALARLDKEKRIRLLVEQLDDTLQKLKDEMGVTGAPKSHQQAISLPDEVSLDLARREMWRGADKVRLTPTEAKLLEIFVTNWGRVMTHGELVFLLQGYEVSDVEAPEILRPLISRLRKKLGEFPRGAKWISSVRGVGYVFDADVLG